MTLRKGAQMVCTVFILMVGGRVMADEVRMKNGDHLTGSIVSLADNVLILRTSYAGDVSIKWEEIASFATESPTQVVLDDETTARGIVTSAEGGKLKLEPDTITGALTFDVAQVELINPPPPGPAVKVTGRANAGIDIRKGNTDTEAYHLDGELVARTKKNRYTVGVETNREEESGNKTADNALAHMSYDHFLSEKWFFFTSADFEKDDFKDLELRTTLGTGLGYQFFETPLKNLSLRTGVSYVNEDYNVEDEDRSYAAGIWAVRYDQYFFEKFVQLFHHHDGLVSLKDTKKVIIRTRTGLRFPLRAGFNATAQYNWDWDNAPAPGTDRVDERYLFTLGYGWE